MQSFGRIFRSSNMPIRHGDSSYMPRSERMTYSSYSKPDYVISRAIVQPSLKNVLRLSHQVPCLIGQCITRSYICSMKVPPCTRNNATLRFSSYLYPRRFTLYSITFLQVFTTFLCICFVTFPSQDGKIKVAEPVGRLCTQVIDRS